MPKLPTSSDYPLILHGDCVEQMRLLADCSIDAIVTDPPYGLEFMGKEWDGYGTNAAFGQWCETWLAECLRVLKPGGHILAFGGTRTWHRLACAAEDVGFEMRDSLAWLYGSGFPKSLNVGKAIDKQDAAGERLRRSFKFTGWVSGHMSAVQASRLTDSDMGHHYTTHPTQPCVATAEMFDKLRPALPAVPEWVEALVAERTVESENFKRRRKVGEKTSGIANKDEGPRYTVGAASPGQHTAAIRRRNLYTSPRPQPLRPRSGTDSGPRSNPHSSLL